MERRLYEASLSGSVPTLNTLIQEDPLILNRASRITRFNETPLHVAAMRGHQDFARTLLTHESGRNLATALDSFGRSPLHLAAAEGNVEIVEELIRTSPEARHGRDEDGRTPLHLAAMNERGGAIKVLIRTRPDLGREEVDNGGTVLHLCVKYNRVQSLEMLLKWYGGDHELVNAKDNNGDTLLHLAVALKQMETVKLLVKKKGGRNVNAVNENGFTALDVLEHCSNRDLKALEIREILVKAEARRGKDLQISTSPQTRSTISKARKLISNVWEKYVKGDSHWSEDSRGNLILAATVTATMAFQAGVNPPGGTWDKIKESEDIYAGCSISSTLDSKKYKAFLVCTTVSFVASLSTILLSISGFPVKNKFTTWLLTLTMSTTIVFMLLTYLVSIIMTAGDETRKDTLAMFSYSIFTWFGLCAIVVLFHTMRFLVWLVNKPIRGFC